METVKIISLVVLYLLVLSRADDFLDDVLVHLSNGVLRGEKWTGEAGNTFYSFRGIPFAEPPLGNLRFKPPVPKKPWKSVLNAIDDGPLCPQLNFFTFEFNGKEDCLYLNVYTPKLSNEDNEKMNVIYHIHGGGFISMAGISTIFGPKRFPLDDVVLVSVTYRVSTLGFLGTNDSASRGNYGLLDQVEGLRWVRNNIHHFGGDPNRVTLLGESAGGASVIFHMLSPLSEGLFHQAVAMSGSALCNWAVQKDPLYWSKKLGNDTGCSTECSEKLVECLREKSAEELITKATSDTEMQSLPFLSIVPTVDNYFIHDTPLNLVKQGKYNKDVPLIIGTTKDEGNCMYLGRPGSPNNFTDEEIEGLIKLAVDIIPDVEGKVTLVKEKYFANLTSYKEEVVQKRVNAMITDGLFHKCIFQTAKEMSASGTKTYIYKYDYEAPFSIAMFYKKLQTYGVCHADDLFMFFDGMFMVASFDERSQQVKQQFQKLFVNFVKYGNPVPATDKNITCEWPQSEMDKLSIYHINENCSVGIYDETKDPLYKFWTEDINEA